MRDQQDGFTFVAQAPQVGEEFRGFLRGQDRGGFIQNQDVGVPVEELENFDTLLHADGQPFHRGIPIHGQAVLLTQDFQPGAGLPPVNHPRAHRLGPQQNIVEGGKGAGQQEMLMHHPQAPGHGSGRGGPDTRIALDENLPGVRPQQAQQQLHGGGFPSAVFPHDAVNGAGRHPQMDVRIRQYAAEPLAQRAQFDGGGRGVGH